MIYWARYGAEHGAERGGRMRRVLNRFDLCKAWAAVRVGLHLGILVLLDVGPFSPISLAYYLCLIPPKDPRPSADDRPGGSLDSATAA